MDLQIPFLIIDLYKFYHFSLRFFKKDMYNRLNCYISKLQILNLTQYGFCNNYSSHLATTDICTNFSKSLDDGKTVIRIFIASSKAFDAVNRNILLDKLN